MRIDSSLFQRISRLDPETVIQQALLTGWERGELKDAFTCMRHPNGDALVPMRSDFDDFAYRMAEAIERISEIDSAFDIVLAFQSQEMQEIKQRLQLVESKVSDYHGLSKGSPQEPEQTFALLDRFKKAIEKPSGADSLSWSVVDDGMAVTTNVAIASNSQTPPHQETPVSDLQLKLQELYRNNNNWMTKMQEAFEAWDKVTTLSLSIIDLRRASVIDDRTFIQLMTSVHQDANSQFQQVAMLRATDKLSADKLSAD